MEPGLRQPLTFNTVAPQAGANVQINYKRTQKGEVMLKGAAFEAYGLFGKIGKECTHAVSVGG